MCTCTNRRSFIQSTGMMALGGVATAAVRGESAQVTQMAKISEDNNATAPHGWMDVHGHFSPPLDEKAKVELQRYLITNNVNARLDQVVWDPATAVQYLDMVDVAMQMLSNAGAHRTDSARHFNDYGAKVVSEFPRRFGLLAIIPAGEPVMAVEEMRRCWNELGCDGFSIVSQYDGTYLGDLRFEPIWAEAERLGATIFLHPLAIGWNAPALGRPAAFLEVCFDTARTVVDMMYAGVFRRHPQLKIILAHAGGALPALAYRVESLGTLNWMPNPNKITATEMRDAMASLYYDTALSATDHALAPLLAVTSSDHIVYGSDYGAPCTDVAVLTTNLAKLKSYGRIPEAQRTALGHNAMRLFPRAASRLDAMLVSA